MTCEECAKNGRVGTRVSETHGEFIIYGCNNKDCSQFLKLTNQEKQIMDNYITPIPEETQIEKLEKRIVELEKNK